MTEPPGGSGHASPRAAFERLLASGKDGALLRYSLGNECLKAGEHDAAIEHLTRATALDPRYTAAWKLLGKALQAAGRDADALTAWRRGIEVARTRGDKQAEREMGVFVRRIEKARKE
ncbi:MAG TPA: tetratricopeptide repeat protein [Casimicrobiaceae bacterium]|jgi:Flp pilus assembly protein TadD